MEKMIKRISVLMSQSNWDEANGLCKRALEIEPENAELYLLLCMIDHKVMDEKTLRKSHSFPLSWDNNFKVAMKFSSPERKKELELVQSEQSESRKKWIEDCSNKKKQAKQKEINNKIGCYFLVLVGSIVLILIIGILSSC